MKISDLIPISPPPAGAHSNFVDPESTSQEMVTVRAVFLTLMLLIFLTRLYKTI